jgi:chorismate dehydratase
MFFLRVVRIGDRAGVEFEGTVELVACAIGPLLLLQLIGDPALLALEERANRSERNDEELVYHDIAHEWRALTGLPFVSAVWAARTEVAIEAIADDFIRSRDHGLDNIDALAAEWSRKLPMDEHTIRAYLSENIHYILDEKCVEGMRGFFKAAAEAGVLPEYWLTL